MYEQRPQVLTAPLGDTHHHCAIAARMLARYQPQPGCQVPAVLEVGSVADRRYHRGCRLRPDPSDLGDPLTNVAGLEDRANLSIESLDAIVDLKHEGVQTRDDFSHHLSQLIVGFRQYFWNQPPCACSRYRDRYPAVEQKSAHLADQCGSMIDQPLPRAVERLDVLLFEGLLRHEPHVPLLYRSADRLCVIAVVLLPAYEWLHVLRGHDLHGVTELLELPLPIECTGRGFDADEARLQFAKDLEQLLAADPTDQDRASLTVDTVELEDILCQVDTENVNF